MGREWHKSSGCMSGILLHLIDFHQLLFTNRRTTEQHTALTDLQGLEEGQCEDASLGMRIDAVRTWTEKKREKMGFFLEEERRSTSQVETPRSPSIVARLMGVEFVPENNPHDHSQKKKKKKKNKNNKQHHIRKPLQVKNPNTINNSSPPSPFPHKLNSRTKASSRHGNKNENENENENENVVKRVKKHCKKNKETKKNKCSRLTEEQEDEYQYVRLVLDYAFKFQCLNPVIFNLLELELEFPSYSQLQHRWNRKLLFHLVGEIVGDLIHGHGFTNNNMLERVWREIRSFPLADCRVIGDIDKLVEGDLVLAGNVRTLMRHPAVVEEVAGVVAEVEKDIVDELVKEMMMMMMLMTWVGFNRMMKLSLRHIYV